MIAYGYLGVVNPYGRSNRSEADKFMGGVREFGVAAGALTTDALRKLAFEGLRRIVLRNPVGNPDLWKYSPALYGYLGVVNPFGFAAEAYVGGRSRQNWQVTIALPAIGVLEGEDQSGNATVQRGLEVLERIPDGTFPTVWTANNLPYIEALEDGWSGQAPDGMLGPTFTELEAVAQIIVDKSMADFNAEPPQ